MLKKLLPILWMALFAMLPGHAQAQSDDPADLLIIVSDGDFWSWSEAAGLTRLTDTGDHYYFDRSPDGRYLVYTAYADFAAEAIREGNYYPNEIYPTDIWRYDLQTGEAVAIASQPAAAVFSRDEVRGYDRFNQRWSPDASKIAWIQLPLGMPEQGGWQLVIYDVAAAVAEVVADHLPGPSGDAGMVGLIGLEWASVGLITETFGGTDDNFFGQAFRVYDENGALLAEQYLTIAPDLYPWFWSDEEAAIIGYGTEYETGKSGYFRVDLLAATQDFLADQLVMTVARDTPDQLVYHVMYDNKEQPLHWWMLGEDAPTVNEVTGGRYFARRVGIHPDGQRLAYITDVLYIWEDGATRRIPDTEQFGETESFSTLLWGEPTQVLMNQADVPFGAE